MGRACKCCGNKKIIAWIGEPLPIFERAISRDYTEAQVLFNLNTSESFYSEDIAGENMDHSPLASQGYSYVPYDPKDYSKYLGVTIGSAFCGIDKVSQYTGIYAPADNESVFDNSEVMSSLKKFKQRGDKDSFIFWHGEWDNWYGLEPNKADNTGCFSINDANYYTLMAKYLEIGIEFLSTTTSPKLGAFQSIDYGVSRHSTSVPFLQDFYNERLFLTAATGAINPGPLSDILWADISPQERGGEAGYYGEINDKGLKLVVVMDSNFCILSNGRSDNVFVLDGVEYNIEKINPLFAKALILFAGREA